MTEPAWQVREMTRQRLWREAMSKLNRETRDDEHYTVFFLDLAVFLAMSLNQDLKKLLEETTFDGFFNSAAARVKEEGRTVLEYFRLHAATEEEYRYLVFQFVQHHLLAAVGSMIGGVLQHQEMFRPQEVYGPGVMSMTDEVEIPKDQED